MKDSAKDTIRRAARHLRKQAMSGTADTPDGATQLHKIASLLDAITTTQQTYAVAGAALRAAQAILGEETEGEQQQPEPA